MVKAPTISGYSKNMRAWSMKNKVVRALLLLIMLAGTAFADVARGGGTSFENADWVGGERFLLAGEPGSNHYFFTNVDPGYALVIDRPCENQLGNLSLYAEDRSPIISNTTKTVWSASSDSLNYKLYFVVAMCTERDWVTVSTEDRQDLGNGDAGKDLGGAPTASGGAFPECCHLSINNTIESGNDHEDTYRLNTKPGTFVTMSTLAPLEIIAYSVGGTEIARAESNLSFMPQSPESYVMVRTTPAFLAGENNTYSLVIEGVGLIEPEQTTNGKPGTPSQQQPATGEKAGAAGKITRQNKTMAGENIIPGDTPEPAKEKGAIETITDQISGTIDRVQKDYLQDNATPEEKQQEETGTNKKTTTVLIILLVVAALFIRRELNAA